MSEPPHDLDHYVAAKVSSGEFETPEAFFLETARIYRELEERHAGLRSLIADRLEEARQGQVMPLDVASLQAELAAELDDAGRPQA
ncbi:MAG: hypothetical protein DWQ31_04010 [Planctomycetota bacterium]|nr:MAG: hypothetical protein DWQ31_04010 [Planctomycetota bacterium]REJ94132.1 MAG: hypothetical protein DWQ35_08925 [Planctomycetota bacterium]REK26318.1 MAG: hypothetical protein DWQ42_09515 [Planctomycetota bacterium]REK45869.1 MAG: hypothetical protein DWQ46_08230 [Planctomycetota bacterium]